jgi:4-amino-4-deoxy-L-arabinose transferase-like glycosyltransferase
MRPWQDTAAEESPTRDFGFSAAIALVALLPRLFVAIAWAREPVWDGHYYHFGAERIAAGFGYTEDVLVAGELIAKPWCHYPVGYSGFLAFFYSLFGSGLVVAPIANALVGTALAVLLHRVARYYLSDTRSRVAAALAALHPGLVLYTVVVMTEQLAAALIVLALWVSLHWRAQWKGILLGGFVIGLATLVRPSCLLAAPLLLLTQAGPWWARLQRGAVASALALVTVLPWTFRNCRVMDGCALVSTNGGWNLAIGALTETGRFVGLRAADGCPVVTGQVQQDRCWGAVGRAAIQRDPARWLSLAPKKLAQTYNHQSFPIEYLREANPDAWPEARRTAGREFLTFFHRLLLCAAALGVIGRVSRRSSWAEIASQASIAALLIGLGIYGFLDDWHPMHWLAMLLPLVGLLPLPGRPWQGPVGSFALAWFLATSVTHAVFFGDDRYHVVVLPMWCLLAAAALRLPLTRRSASGAAVARIPPA